MRPVRLGLIGFGRWGRNYVKAARESGEAEVISVATRAGSSVTREEIIGCGVPQSTDRPDAVVFAGHPSDAARACEQALAAGFPVLCEKPAGLSLSEASRIAFAESRSKSFVLVGHQHLFSEGYEALRGSHSPERGALARWLGPARRDYSPIWDYGPHAIALGLGWLGGAPDSVQVVKGEDCATITMRPQVGSPVHCVVGSAPEKEALFILAHKEWESVASYDAYAPAEPPLTRQVRAFARAVRAGGTDDWRFGARWAVNVARILEAAAPV